MKTNTMTKIKLVEGGKWPVQMSEGAGCLDVFARDIKYSKESGYLEVMLGFQAEVPKGYVMELIARSSVSDKGMFLCNGVGQIDSDFRGEVRARFFPAMTPKLIDAAMQGAGGMAKFLESKYSVGDAVAQIKVVKEDNNTIVRTEDDLSSTKRGEKGFGSTTQQTIGE